MIFWIVELSKHKLPEKKEIVLLILVNIYLQSYEQPNTLTFISSHS